MYFLYRAVSLFCDYWFVIFCDEITFVLQTISKSLNSLKLWNFQVTVYRLICKGTIEERILQRAREKSKIQKLVISGGSFKPDTLKPTEVISLLLDNEEIERKCNVPYPIAFMLFHLNFGNCGWLPVDFNIMNLSIETDRQRQAERKQQEIERETERKRKYMGGTTTTVLCSTPLTQIIKLFFKQHLKKNDFLMNPIQNYLANFGILLLSRKKDVSLF